jgi:hypothetical protein
MSKISHLAFIAAVATATASSALAQSFDPDAGTGNVAPLRFQQSAAAPVVAHRTVAKRNVAQQKQNGLDAFALVPRSANDPALTGGGSIGYNEMVKQAW